MPAFGESKAWNLDDGAPDDAGLPLLWLLVIDVNGDGKADDREAGVLFWYNDFSIPLCAFCVLCKEPLTSWTPAYDLMLLGT